jgi:predicted RNA binding protein YcfA (HicA-like mRNA interferase family)
MNKLLQIKSDELIRILKKQGFILHTKKGSHFTFKHPKTKVRVTIPSHKGVALKPGLLHGVLKQLGWSIEDLRKFKK